ncbi:FtsK/SpoIIIE domain-containing protein [Nocardia transvalensis]|uniref:FtsK/SpoIIIE domain-containing protein n=1 Tax=Nocardia transvalensis TaxID=37333 RepID=UPI0018952F70|nr:FtsK/SpoIIIE domain-containing protein [Nocardia transvalensis]MBF6333573.1 hypothetical protein [Nocardia transvalensis]
MTTQVMQQQPSVKLTPPAYSRSAPLPPRHHPWIRNTSIVLLCAAGVQTGAPMLGMDSWGVPVTVTGMVLAAAGVAVNGRHRRLREQDVDRCAEQLCGVLAMPPTRAVMKTKCWQERNLRDPGRPGRIIVRYPDAGRRLDPEMETRVDEIMSGQAWGRYRRVAHDERKCQLVYVIDRSPLPVPDPEPVARAKRLVLKILGPTAVIDDKETSFDEATGEISRIAARHDDGGRFALSGYRDRIERTLSAVLPGGRWRAKWDLEHDKVLFELRPPLGKLYWKEPIADPHTPYEDVFIPYGRDEDGNVLGWRPAIDPHVIFIGATGTGKTAAVHTVVTELAGRNWIVQVVDGKGTEFIGFRDWPNIQIVASKIEHQIAVIHRAWEEMEKRYAAIEDGADESDFTPFALVVDEFADFKSNLETWYALNRVKGERTQPPALLEIASLVRKGRSARVHVVLSTQRPDADFFGGRGKGDTRDSLRLRVSLGSLSPQGAMMMWNSPTTGTSIPRIRGRGTAVTDDNVPVEIQCFYTPDPRRTKPDTEAWEHLQRLRPPEAVHQRLVILPPVEDEEGEVEEEAPQGRRRRGARPQPRRAQPKSRYQQVANAPWGWAADYPDHDPVRRRALKVANRGAHPRTYTLIGLDEFLVTPTRRTRWGDPTVSSGNGNGSDGNGSSNGANGSGGRPSLSTLLTAAAAGPNRPALRVVPTPTPADDDSDDTEYDDETDADDTDADTTSGDAGDGGDADPWDEEYDSPEPAAPMEVEVGDLVFVEDIDDWAVVTAEPGPDLLDDDEHIIAITYRTDDDSDQLLLVPEDDELTVRHPFQYD